MIEELWALKMVSLMFWELLCRELGKSTGLPALFRWVENIGREVMGDPGYGPPPLPDRDMLTTIGDQALQAVLGLSQFQFVRVIDRWRTRSGREAVWIQYQAPDGLVQEDGVYSDQLAMLYRPGHIPLRDRVITG